MEKDLLSADVYSDERDVTTRYSRPHNSRVSSSVPGALLPRGPFSRTPTSGTPWRWDPYKKRRSESEVDSDSRRATKMLKLESMMTTKMIPTTPLSHGAVFYPTLDQFADPIKYIARYARVGTFSMGF